MMHGLSGRLVRRTAFVLAILLRAAAPTEAQDRQEFRVSRVPAGPTIDGQLDDAAWQAAPLALSTWISYNPLRGDSGPERTEVRVAYDDRFLYFAFTCRSEEPLTIRTTTARRDTIFSDDWVGLSLDSTGAGQTAYHLMVNPSGIQMDAVQTPAGGERFESDFVWVSAGQRTADGYVVELAVPLQTIRFANRPDLSMGILFWRHVSRSGMSYSWPDLPPGQWVFERHAHLVFPDLKPRRLVELLPSMTMPLAQSRGGDGRWMPIGGGPDAGLSLKVGVTPEVTVDATINPDFSQVESDAFQVQTNQRFPVFFTEKRPFFMEGLGLFAVAGSGGDFNMRRSVHTRRIVNPSWGAKVIGTSGRLSFGVLESSDATPEIAPDFAPPPEAGKTFSIGRLTYALGSSNYVGAIATDTRIDGRRNRVIGADASWRPSPTQGLTVTYLSSHTSARGRDDGGAAAQASYNYNTRFVNLSSLVEHYDRGFAMDTAFYNRTGFTSVFTFAARNFYPESARRIGVIRLYPLAYVRRGHDHLQGGDDGEFFGGIAFNFVRQGWLRLQHGRGHERWAGQRFRTDEPLSAFGGVQIFRWLSVNAGLFPRTWGTFYDSQPFQGRSTSGNIEFTWQPNEHFNQTLSYNAVRFTRADTGARVYSVDILNLKTIYQFNRRLMTRLLTQFDGSRPQWLTDVLASYEFVPGTGFHAGYGAIYERQGAATIPPGSLPAYMTIRRGLFFKASYLRRL